MPRVSQKAVTEAWGLWNAWLSRHQSPPPLLYHYTTAEGLLGMLQSRQLWATNVRFMNDTSEMAHGIELVRETFTTIEPEVVRRSSIRKLAFESARTAIDAMVTDAEKFTKHFAVSFCSDGNLLSQWRGYGQLGGGFAVGFASQDVGRYAAEILSSYQGNPKDLAVFLRKVEYKEDEQRDLVRGWIRFLVDTLAAVKDHRAMLDAELWTTGPAGVVARMIYECLVCFKHHGFAEEGEYRLIQQGRIGSEDVCKVAFRARSGRLVSYAPLTFEAQADARSNNLPIKSITYGPTLDSQAAERAVRWLLENHRFDAEGVLIQASGIPFTG